ncbi:MAG: nitroreductase/quinone reductase family protein [Acidimicrobiales bacterium]
MPVTEQIHYKKPGWFTRNIFNRTVSGLTRAGVSIFGSRVLEVKGRSSGLPRQTPVNVLTLEGRQYLVSPRGEGEWVKNLRASGGQLDLLLGRGRVTRHAVEVADADKVPVLRGYLTRWKFEVGQFFEGVGPGSTDEQILAIAPKHPVFLLDPPEGRTQGS